jgi:hypothetical protein
VFEGGEAMTELRKAAERLLEALEDGWVQRDDWVAFELRQAIEQAEKPTRNAADFLAEKQGAFRDPMVNILEFYKPEQDSWNPSDMAHRSGGLSVEQEPVAWVRDLTSPQPHCVTSMKYLSIADTDARVKYIPVYTAPPKREWVGLTDEERCTFVTWLHCQTINEIFNAIEAKLKEKNT